MILGAIHKRSILLKGGGRGHKIRKMDQQSSFMNLQLEYCLFLHIFEHKYANTKK